MNYKNIFVFSMISQDWAGIDWQKTYFSYLVDTICAEGNSSNDIKVRIECSGFSTRWVKHWCDKMKAVK